MKPLWSSIFVLVSISLFSQTDSLILDTIWWNNGNVKSIESYLNEKNMNSRHGCFTYFYETGELEQRRYYKNGTQDSTLTYYYKNGNKKEEGLLNPCQIGQWITWHENGQKKSQGQLDCGQVRLNKWHFWDSTGLLELEVSYHDSIYYSIFYHYHKNSQIRAIEKYSGTYLVTGKLFFIEGNRREDSEEYITRDFSGLYKHMPRGVWQTFDEKGTLVSEEEYSKE